MARYSLAEAQERLPELLATAKRGEEVVISDGDDEALILQFPAKPTTFALDPSWFEQNGVPRPLAKPLTRTGADIIREMRDEGY